MATSDPVAENLCHTKVSKKTCNILWTIDNFRSVHKKRTVTLNSSSFSANNDEFEWVLHLNPDDLNNYSGYKYITLQVSPKQVSDLAKFAPISGTIKCCLMNADKVQTNSHNQEFLIGNSAHANFISFNSFVEETHLLNQDNRLLPHDKLTIFCEISYIKKTDIVNVKGQPFPDLQLVEHIPPCLDGLDSLFLNPEFSDITLHVNGKDYPAHKNILAARSSVFKAMLTNNMKEKHTNRIEIKDIDEPTLIEMLRFIYTGQPQNVETMVSELLAAADKYDLEKLRNICEKELYENLSSETAVNTLMLAYMHHANTLKTQALQYIKIHSYNTQILDNEARNMLVESCPLLLLEILDAFGKQ